MRFKVIRVMSEVAMRIGELARTTGASVRSLRYYEEQQLLAPARTSGGHREYDADDVARVELIRCLIAAGLPTAAVIQILPCAFSGTTTPQMIDRLLAERARIDARARELLVTLDRLDEVVAAARERLAA